MTKLEYCEFKKILNCIYINKADVNRKYIEKIIPIVEKAKQTELTARQHECFSMYYEKNLTIYKIATLLNLSPATVCIHIKKARRQIYEAVRNFIPSISLNFYLRRY